MSKLKSFLKTDVFAALLVSVVWQVLLLFLGVLFDRGQGLLGHMNHWDAGWYLHIVQFSYGLDGSPAAPAFYPLFPLVISALSTLTFGLIPEMALALFVNTIALWAGVLALIRILKHFNIPTAGIKVGVLAFLAFPSAFFLHVFYSEALFISLAFWAYYFALTKKWWAMGLLLAILTAARLPSLLFVALCGLEYLRAYKWNSKKALNKNILWFLLAPIGLICYGLYLLFERGNFFAMFEAYSTTSDWTYQVFNPNIFATLFETIATIFTAVIQQRLNYEIFINYALPLASIALIIAAGSYLLYKLKKDGVPLFVFSILAVILFTLNSNVVSVHRYTLACIVLFIAVGFLSKKQALRISLVLCCVLSACIQLFLYSRFIANVFAG